MCKIVNNLALAFYVLLPSPPPPILPSNSNLGINTEPGLGFIQQTLLYDKAKGRHGTVEYDKVQKVRSQTFKKIWHMFVCRVRWCFLVFADMPGVTLSLATLFSRRVHVEKRMNAYMIRTLRLLLGVDAVDWRGGVDWERRYRRRKVFYHCS